MRSVNIKKFEGSNRAPSRYVGSRTNVWRGLVRASVLQTESAVMDILATSTIIPEIAYFAVAAR